MNIILIFATAILLVLPPRVLPADDIPVIRSGCSGGFTGGGSGYEIRQDGSISSWRMDSFNTSPETTLIRSDKAAADRLFALFDKAGFARIEHNESGNMTCCLTFESAGKSHTVCWSHKPPQPVRELSDAVTAVVTGKPGSSTGELTIIRTVPAPTLKPVEKHPTPTPKPEPTEKHPGPQ